MNTAIRSNIRILDSLVALNLNISVWSARKKMCLEDFGGAELPPEDLASLGSKRIADPDSLKVFSTLKARAFNYLDRHGIRFMSGWAIPEDKAGDIIKELIGIREQIALQPADVLGGVVNKAVVIIGGLGGFQQDRQALQVGKYHPGIHGRVGLCSFKAVLLVAALQGLAAHRTR